MTSATTAEFEGSQADVAARKRARRRAMMFAGPVVLLLAGAGVWLVGGRYQTTDNAYFHQARIAVASSVGGRVT